jgi:hypothetical protein
VKYQQSQLSSKPSGVEYEPTQRRNDADRRKGAEAAAGRVLREASEGRARPGRRLAAQIEDLTRAARTLELQIGYDQASQRNLEGIRQGSLFDRGIGWSIEATARFQETLSGTNDRYLDPEVSLPPSATWSTSHAALREGLAGLTAARARLVAGDLGGAHRELVAAAAALDHGRAMFQAAHRRLAEYVERSQSGATPR